VFTIVFSIWKLGMEFGNEFRFNCIVNIRLKTKVKVKGE
jgi:hypothetical protein